VSDRGIAKTPRDLATHQVNKTDLLLRPINSMIEFKQIVGVARVSTTARITSRSTTS